MRLIDADALLESLIFPSEQWKASFKQLLDDEPTAYPNERIKVLIDASNRSMEELLALGGMVAIEECGICPLKHKCVGSQLKVNPKTGLYWTCEDLWTAYLKGEIDGKET